MSENIWPRDAFQDASRPTDDDSMRPFQCVLLTPIGPKRFEDLARFVERVVNDLTQSVLPGWFTSKIERLDWVDSTGAIHHQLWDRLASADLVICDLTGQNPNVMFEAGVCAARKRPEQVIFIRDAFYRPEQPFDIQPFRYLSYEMTTDGQVKFEEKLRRLLLETIARFPDRADDTDVPPMHLPLRMQFADGNDDARLLTPPLSHRRVANGYFEFGSLVNYPHSWASVGRERFSTFRLEFVARFGTRAKDHGFIGVGFRSHNVLVPFCHALGLHLDGSVKAAFPDDASPAGYHDKTLRDPQAIDVNADHRFVVELTNSRLALAVDDCAKTFEIIGGDFKLLAPGLIRFQSQLCRMAIRSLSISEV
jgi:hypothetical protein